MAASKIVYLTYQTFSWSFCFCTIETTQSRNILLPDNLLSILQFFQFYFYSTKSKPFFLLLYFLKFTVHFLLKFLRHFYFQFLYWLKTLVYYSSRKKSHAINRKVEHYLTFWKSYMINDNVQKWPHFLKCIMWFDIYDESCNILWPL